jgi:hypothetical protein
VTARSVSDINSRLKDFVALGDMAALALVEQVMIAQGRIDIQLSRPAVAEKFDLKPDTIASAFLQRAGTFQMRRRGVEARLLLGDDPTMIDPALLKFVARAHVWWERIRGGSTLGELARRQGVTKRFIGLHLPAAFLAPDILELIVAGRQPSSLTAQALRTQTIPSLWKDQRVLFGLPNVTAKPVEKFPVR